VTAPQGPGATVAGAGAAVERVLFAPRPVTPVGPDCTEDVLGYQTWARERQDRRRSTTSKDQNADAIDVIIVVGAADSIASVHRSVSSVVVQTGAQWTLTIAAIGPSAVEGAQVLEETRKVRGVNVRALPASCTVASAAANVLEGSDEPFVLLLQPGDQLAPDALALLGAALGGSRPADVAYADHDYVDDHGEWCRPALKADWSPELLLCTDYLGAPVLIRRTLLSAVGGITDVEGGDWEHDLALRVTEAAAGVTHVAEVLCHRPIDRADRASAGSAAVAGALLRRGEFATVTPGPIQASWSITRKPSPISRASVIIPFRDGAPLLRTCIDSIRATANVDYELVLIDNGSVEPETQSLLEQLGADPDVVVTTDPRPFNWAALNNAAVDTARSEVLVFLNNDIEAHRPGWLGQLVAQAARPEVGVVGARLLYPGGRVQHAGVVIGMGGAAGHVLAGLGAEEAGYLGMALLARNCSAVTGACMAIRRSHFEELGRFDESLGIDLNDVDFCMRSMQAGYRIVYEPLAELIHHESPSRGTSGSVKDIARFVDRWRVQLENGDLFLNANLTRRDPSCALRSPGEDEWWEQWCRNLES